MLQQKTIKIGETEYIIEQLPTTKGLEVTFAIAQILKGLAEGASEEFIFNLLETKLNIGKSIAGVISCTDVKETPIFIKGVICDSVKKPDMGSDETLFDLHFAGNYEELSELFSEIIMFNKFHELVKKNLFQLIELFPPSE